MEIVLLIILLLDQFLYPLLFTLSMPETIFTMKKNLFYLAIITGNLIFLAVFFSFSLLHL